ncbi:hypothetical protein [Amycolatopsis australiensis]|nr:hypothetical protein [Amycolatopsis australiensis]
MTTSPFEPDPHVGEQEIAAADPGPGAPETADGFGPGATGPDVIVPGEDDDEPEG